MLGKYQQGYKQGKGNKMNTYQIYGYENYQTIVATINCDTLDEASAWAQSTLGAKGWSTIHKGS